VRLRIEPRLTEAAEKVVIGEGPVTQVRRGEVEPAAMSIAVGDASGHLSDGVGAIEPDRFQGNTLDHGRIRFRMRGD
jgi:hypothetical protein